jgi:hypothetical protein
MHSRFSRWALYTGAEDSQELAAEALTDGPDDKKLDFCYLDLESRRLVIAQGYTSQTWGKPAALANKASDLNTAVAWLFAVNEEHIPDHFEIKSAGNPRRNQRRNDQPD